MAPASSAAERLRARDGGLGAAAGSSMPFIAYVLLFAIIVAAVGGGGLILARRLLERLDISAESRSLGADGSVAAFTLSAIR